MKAVFLDLESLDCGDLDMSVLTEHFESFEAYASTSPDQVVARIEGADVVIVNKVVLDADILIQAKDLKLICIAATGTNNVALEVAAQRGIKVANCQAYGVASVVQHVMTLMLALHTNLIAYDRAARNGQWAKASQFCLLDYPVQELEGKTLGIVGYGNLGSGVARLAEAFGMQVLVAQRGDAAAEGRVPLDQLLRQVDVLTLHCPLTDTTQDLIDEQALTLMKPSAFLINAARGGVVNEQALADALRSGKLAGAATDVLTEEPPVNGNPLLAEDIPNLIITPHSAWGSVQARQRIVNQMAETVAAFSVGKKVRIVN